MTKVIFSHSKLSLHLHFFFELVFLAINYAIYFFNVPCKDLTIKIMLRDNFYLLNG